MDSIHEAFTDDEDFLELADLIEDRRSQETYMERKDHFSEWSDKEFRNLYRLSKDTVRFLVRELSNEISNKTNRNNSISPEDMVLLTLRFLASGCFLRVAGDYHGIHESTASRIVVKVLYAIAKKHRSYIKMPTTIEERCKVQQGFYDIARFPRCIGALDCTHVEIQAPSLEGPEIFRCRKGYFFFNVQAILLCDADLNFLSIVCRWPGSTHYATIFANSRVRALFEDGTFQDGVLVGDSGCGVKNYLMNADGNQNNGTRNAFINYFQTIH